MSESENDNDSVVNYNKLVWNTSVEKLFINWCDLAACYKWLHEKAHHKYRRINYGFAIPIIVLSTLTGTANIGIGGLVPENSVQTANVVIGLVSITTGIIGTLQNFFRYPQLSEAHLNAYVGWSRLQRLINTELNLERKARRNTGDFLKICRNEFERLMEQSPIIPPDVSSQFSDKFGKDKALHLPDTLNSIKHTTIYPDSEEEELDMILQNDKMKQLFDKKIQDTIKARQTTSTLKQKLLEKLSENKLKESADKSMQKIQSHVQSHAQSVSQTISQSATQSQQVSKNPDDIPKTFTERFPPNTKKPIMDGEIKINIKDIIKKLETSNIPQTNSQISSQPNSARKKESSVFSVVENENANVNVIPEDK